MRLSRPSHVRQLPSVLLEFQQECLSLLHAGDSLYFEDIQTCIFGSFDNVLPAICRRVGAILCGVV